MSPARLKDVPPPSTQGHPIECREVLVFMGSINSQFEHSRLIAGLLLILNRDFKTRAVAAP
jgi:histone deacetylase complex regulatory component SIN3